MSMGQQTTVQRGILDATRVGLVADDLTGATDSAVQFARAGWKARLALTSPGAGSAERGAVVAVVTDARAQNPGSANAGTAAAVTALLASGIERLFLKIDSTLRGSVIDQVTGALEAWSAEHPNAIAVVCSAYPAMGRTIEDGHLLVHGAGVHTTAIGRDPVTPVTTSAVQDVIPGSTALRLTGATAAENAVQLEAAASAAPSRIVAVDATTDDDLANLARALGLLGPRAIPVGAAGLAVAMSQVWAGGTPDPRPDHATPRVERVVVVVSSLHDVSRNQVEELIRVLPADQLRIFAPTLEQALVPSAMVEWTARELAKAPRLPAVVVIASPSERRSPESGTLASPASVLVAESLAIISDAVFHAEAVGAFLLLGGEGARAVLDILGSESLLVRDTVREGIPIATLEGGKADGVTVVTKAGGFGTPTSVAEIVPGLLRSELLTTGSINTEGNLS